MIRRLLIANRGEIALRIIRACRELGIETSRCIPTPIAARRTSWPPTSPSTSARRPPPRVTSTSSACSRPRVRAGADAVHPGYGFLSERAHFARACRDAGLIFVGPPPEAIERMGSKIGARQLMQQAGVPVVPGETPADQSDASLAASAERDRLSRAHQAIGGWRRHRHEDDAQPGRSCRGRAARAARGRRGLRRRHALRRAARRAAAARRDPGVRRRARPRGAPLRARVLGAAAASEGRSKRAPAPR